MSFDPTSYPYDTVVYITDTIGGESFQGSGVLIAPDEVLTASHVVYSSDNGTASDITVTPGYYAGSAPFGSAAGVSFHYIQIDDSGDLIALQQSQYDYAVIHLSTPFNSLCTMGLQPNFPGGDVNVTGYPAILAGQPENSQQFLQPDPVYTLLDGTALGPGSSGGPVWITDSNGNPYVVGLVSSIGGPDGNAGYFTQITTAAFNQIESWVMQDNPPPPAAAAIAVQDTTTNTAINAAPQPYTGPVSLLQNEYINITSDSLNISVGTPNWFIHSGSGNDAIAVSSGTNVIDGGTGSNFLTGGTGTDTFFVDDRGPAADLWSTVDNFHAGDAATIWGVTQQDFILDWVDGQGAAGFTGLTLHAMKAGAPTASLTLSGYGQADLNDGRLSVSFATDPASGSPYMYVQATS